MEQTDRTIPAWQLEAAQYILGVKRPVFARAVFINYAAPMSKYCYVKRNDKSARVWQDDVNRLRALIAPINNMLTDKYILLDIGEYRVILVGTLMKIHNRIRCEVISDVTDIGQEIKYTDLIETIKNIINIYESNIRIRREQ